jgi:hypothetical protein
MEMQGGRNQEKARRLCLKSLARKIPRGTEIITGSVPMHAYPVVKRLERKVKILRCLHLHYRQAARVIYREQIQYAPVPTG